MSNAWDAQEVCSNTCVGHSAFLCESKLPWCSQFSITAENWCFSTVSVSLKTKQTMAFSIKTRTQTALLNAFLPYKQFKMLWYKLNVIKLHRWTDNDLVFCSSLRFSRFQFRAQEAWLSVLQSRNPGFHTLTLLLR